MALLDLHMPIDPEGSVAAVAPLAWCVTKNLLGEVEQRGFVNPKLLVVVRNHLQQRFAGDDYGVYNYSRAFAVPLDQAMQYVSFTQPGENELLCFVVDVASDEQARGLKRLIKAIERDADVGITQPMNADGSIDSWVSTYLGLKVMTLKPEVLTVHVPQDMFAKEPAAWRKKTVKVFFKNKTIDQCHFRKRFWFAALPLGVVLSIIGFMIKIVLAVGATLLGFFGLQWSVFKRPLAWSLDLLQTSYFAPLYDSPSSTSERFGVWSVVNIYVAACLFGLYHLVRSDNFLAIFLGTAVGLLVTGVLFGAGVVRHHPKIVAWRRKRAEAAYAKERDKRLDNLEAMLCTDNLPANSLSDLPREKRIVSLRFADLKTKVCRPFAS